MPLKQDFSKEPESSKGKRLNISDREKVHISNKSKSDPHFAAVVCELRNSLIVPHSGTFHEMEHFYQIYSKGDKNYFKKFDFGKKRNLEMYGSEEPPSYNLKQVRKKLRMYFAEEDFLTSEGCQNTLFEELVNCDVTVFDLEGYTHGSFFSGPTVRKLFEETILKPECITVAEFI